MPPPVSPSPQHPIPAEPDTDPNLRVSPEYVKGKVADAIAEAKQSSWRAGWSTGIGVVLIITGVLFGGWFKINDAIAQAKTEAVKDAGADTNEKIAPMRTELAVMKNDMATLKDDVKDIKAKQSDDAAAQKQRDEEILRLLRKRDP